MNLDQIAGRSAAAKASERPKKQGVFFQAIYPKGGHYNDWLRLSARFPYPDRVALEVLLEQLGLVYNTLSAEQAVDRCAIEICHQNSSHGELVEIWYTWYRELDGHIDVDLCLDDPYHISDACWQRAYALELIWLAQGLRRCDRQDGAL